MKITDRKLFHAAMEAATSAELAETIDCCCEAIAGLPLLHLRVTAAYHEMQIRLQKELTAMQVVTKENLFETLQGLMQEQAQTMTKLTMLLAVHEAIGFEAGCHYGHTAALGEMGGGSLEEQVHHGL